MLSKEELTKLVNIHPDTWWEGYDAAIGGKSAVFCPYTPRSEGKMFAWLSGHVTAKDEMESGDFNASGR